jgi:hypothetical protein
LSERPKPSAISVWESERSSPKRRFRSSRRSMPSMLKWRIEIPTVPQRQFGSTAAT